MGYAHSHPLVMQRLSMITDSLDCGKVYEVCAKVCCSLSVGRGNDGPVQVQAVSAIVHAEGARHARGKTTGLRTGLSGAVSRKRQPA